MNVLVVEIFLFMVDCLRGASGFLFNFGGFQQRLL